MRAVLGLVVLAALAAVGWIVVADDPPELVGAQPAPVEVALEPEPPAPLAPAPAPASSAEVAPGASREALAAAPEGGGDVDRDPAAALDRLFGRVVLSDEQGAPIPGGSGVLTWICWKGDHGRHVEVAVEGGQWSVSLEDLGEPEGLQVHRLELDGERFVVDEPEARIDVPQDRFVEVVAHRPPRTALRVVDAATGAELDGLRLARSGGGGWGDEEHPGLGVESRLLGQGLHSPIDLTQVLDEELRRTLRANELFVAAEGYAWSPANVDLAVGGEFLVGLKPGGDLVVTFVGYEPADRGELRLRAPGHGRPLITQPLRKAEPARITGLPVGEVRVGVEVGPWYDSPLVLGEASVTVSRDAPAELTLEVEAAPQPEYGAASGVLLVPEAWGDVSTGVTAEFLGTALAGFDDHQSTSARRTPDADRGAARAHAWSFPKLQVGSYELSLRDPPFSITIDVPAGGREDFVFELPPPADLLVRVVDERTGDDLLTDALNWYPKRPRGVTGGSLEQAEYDEELGRYRIRGPEMEIELMLWDWGYTPASATVDLAAGVREHTLRLRRASVIEVTLVDGETPVAFPESRGAGPQPAEGTEGRVSLTQTGDQRWRFQMSAPGRYRLELPQIPGYRPVEPLTIDLLEAETSKQVVELRRL